MNATQIVLGATRRSRWAELAKGSRDRLGDPRLGRGHRRPRDQPRGRRRSAPRRAGRHRSATARDLRSRARGGPAPAPDPRPRTSPRPAGAPERAVAVPASRRRRLGRRRARPALAAAVAAFLLTNWYFAPLYTFTIGDTENLLALSVFLVVAATVSGFVSLAARRAAEGRQARAEAETLLAWRARPASQTFWSRSGASFQLEGVTLWHRTETIGADAGVGTALRRSEADAAPSTPITSSRWRPSGARRRRVGRSTRTSRS